MSNHKNDMSIEQSLTDLMRYIKYTVKFLVKTIYIPILLAAGYGIYTYNKIQNKPAVYNGNIKFVKTAELNTNPIQGGGISGLGLGAAKNKSDNTIEVILSDVVLGSALFLPVEQGSEKLLINEYVDTYYKGDDFEYYENPNLDSLSIKQKIYYKNILETLKSEFSAILTVDTEIVISISSSTLSENLTFGLLNNLYSELAFFYDSTKFTKASSGLERLKRKRDSTNYALQSYQTKLAKIQNKGLLDVQPTDRLQQVKLSDKIAIARQQFVQFESQLQSFDLQVASSEPTYRLLSSPIKPLATKKPKIVFETIKSSLIGLVAGVFLALFVLVFLRAVYYYKKA